MGIRKRILSDLSHRLLRCAARKRRRDRSAHPQGQRLGGAYPLGCNAVYFSPIFESDSHGYDTRDFRKVDCRLGTNEDFAAVCKTLHEHGIKVVLDGVFNHVGRGFWAFKDVQEKKWDSPYKDWFHISFDGNSNYNDGFWYEGWEGHFELVKLNLRHPDVQHHIFECMYSAVEGRIRH